TSRAALVVETCWLPKVREAGLRVTAGAVPTPVRLAAWGLPVALSVTVSAALRLPVAVGVKVTLTAQLELLARLAGQLLVCAKSRLLPPLIEMLMLLRVALPVFESVTV